MELHLYLIITTFMVSNVFINFYYYVYRIFVTRKKNNLQPNLHILTKNKKNVSLACVQKILRKRRLCTKANLHIFVVKCSWSMASFTSITSRCSGK